MLGDFLQGRKLTMLQTNMVINVKNLCLERKFALLYVNNDVIIVTVIFCKK